jgi:hypothetical protein
MSCHPLLLVPLPPLLLLPLRTAAYVQKGSNFEACMP